MPTQIISGVVLVALAGIYWFQADVIPKSPMSGSVGADGLPKLLAFALGGLSLLLIAQGVLSRSSSPPADIFEETEADRVTERRGHLMAAALLVVTILYTVLLPYVGYTVAMGLLLITVGVFYNRRLTLGIGMFAVIGAVVFHLIFITLLGVRMPEGIWPDLFAALHTSRP
ncbi:tripartite tricarboxylate transporter TctB family protein [Ancylobacter sp. A5.8]|uniref:tripartite tricarboxylate transporter TctB family protein n=1 Tax=Ancylobacter gelatini TaxID=2919920 RepID=UPI001F4E1360|nr:tripartite tricarboxylate transporter TctB family protein [Ancylobacter gelatini]MCJ8144016.1 tripartite tricarboxylate transporter TctB family protein [Ancylobacter gelatini]